MSIDLSIRAAALLSSAPSSLHPLHDEAGVADAGHRADYDGTVPHGPRFPPLPLHFGGPAGSVGAVLRSLPGTDGGGNAGDGPHGPKALAAVSNERTSFQNAIWRGVGRGVFGDAIGGSVPLIEIIKQYK